MYLVESGLTNRAWRQNEPEAIVKAGQVEPPPMSNKTPSNRSDIDKYRTAAGGLTG